MFDQNKQKSNREIVGFHESNRLMISNCSYALLLRGNFVFTSSRFGRRGGRRGEDRLNYNLNWCYPMMKYGQRLHFSLSLISCLCLSQKSAFHRFRLFFPLWINLPIRLLLDVYIVHEVKKKGYRKVTMRTIHLLSVFGADDTFETNKQTNSHEQEKEKKKKKQSDDLLKWQN